MQKESKTIAVIGLGYVGLPLSLLSRKKGYRVVGIDIDEAKVNSIRNNTSPFKDEKIDEDFKKYSIEATTDFRRVNEADIIIICVPTPVDKDNMPDLSPIENTCKSIGPFLKKGQLVVLESTVNPGVSETVVLPLLEEFSGLKGGDDFYLSHCPERINPGDKKWNVENINRVIGSLDDVGLFKAVEFYESIISGNIKRMGSLKEAEAVKVVENSFRDINIAFVNELAMSFDHLDIDVVRVIEGASTKPFAFMAHYPGCGVGGHCIPVDPYYLIEYAKKSGFDHKFLSLARRINSNMPKFTADQVINILNKNEISAEGAKVAVLGLSYKPEIDDLRESPSVKIIEHLKNAGLSVSSYDPFTSSTESLSSAIDGATAVVVATAHNIFKEIDPEYLVKNGVRIVVDGRNCLDKEAFIKAGIIYKGIGR